MKIFFILSWVVIVFLALRYVGRRFFEERRAVVFAASVAVAFLAGMAWTIWGGSSPSSADLQAPYLAAHDVTGQCDSAHFSGAVKPLGNIDGMGDLQAGQMVSEANGFVAGSGAMVWAAGWAANVPGKVPAQAACIVIDGKLRPDASGEYGSGRPDVATATQTDALTLTGFRVITPVSGLRPGMHHVTVAVVLPSGEADALPSSWTIRIP